MQGGLSTTAGAAASSELAEAAGAERPDGARRWASWAAAGCAWLVARAAQLELGGWGTGNDIYLYLNYADSWGGGAAPYVNFHPEYPPGALPLFLVPLLVGGREDYGRAFAGEMAAFDFASLLLVVAFARRLLPGSRSAGALAGLGYLACTAALFPVLYTRFDLVPGTLLLAALYLSYTPGRARLGALLLGLAGGVKLWPLALFPLWVLLAFRRGRWRAAALTGAYVLAGMVLTAVPFLPRAGAHVLDFLRFHAARGIQIESTWSTIALSLGALDIAPAVPLHEYGAFHVTGSVARWFARLSVPALLALALVPQLLAFRGQLGRARDAAGHVGLYAAAGSVLGFMVGGKVLSPQFLLWVAPLLPALVVATGSRGQRIALASAALAVTGVTSLVYPYWSPALEQREPGHVAALIAVGTRNLLLLGLYAFAVACAARAAPRSHRPV